MNTLTPTIHVIFNDGDNIYMYLWVLGILLRNQVLGTRFASLATTQGSIILIFQMQK